MPARCAPCVLGARHVAVSKGVGARRSTKDSRKGSLLDPRNAAQRGLAKSASFFFVLVVSKGCKPQYRSRFKRMRYIPTTACALSFSFALSKKPPPPPITGRVSTRHQGSTMTLRSAWSPSVFPHRILLGFWMPLPLPPPKPPPYLSYPLPPPLGRARFQARRTLARACFLLFLVLRRRRLRGLRRIFRFRLRLATDMRDETIGAYRAEDCRGDEGSSRWISKWTGLDYSGSRTTAAHHSPLRARVTVCRPISAEPHSFTGSYDPKAAK